MTFPITRCSPGAGTGRFRESDLFRQLFKIVVARCIDEGLVGRDILSADASISRSDANLQNSFSTQEQDALSLDPEVEP
jgi:hypothetical protein